MRRLVLGVLISSLGFCSQAGGQGGIITTVAGGGTGALGDGGPATSATLQSPAGVAVDASGNLFIADLGDNRIRKISASGLITTVAGNGTKGFSGDGGPATSASFFYPSGVAVDASGNLFVADSQNERIRKVSASGIITTIAGNGTKGFSGDGGPATSASLNLGNIGVAVDASGNVFIPDTYNNRVRKVSAASGIITTVAGNGSNGPSGEGGPATSAPLYSPADVAVDASGNLFIADNIVLIRKVSAGGIITTVAGNGAQSYSGDGGPATSASLGGISGVAVDASGNLFIADASNNRIRKVSASGIITTVAGNGTKGFSGDGGPATTASLNNPEGVALDNSGNLFIADWLNGRIREVSAPAPTTSPDTIENLVFTGTASCADSFCSKFGSGLITGTYSLDVTAQAIVGAWSFSTPFGVISSSDPGANASVAVRLGYINPYFGVTTPTFNEFVQFYFPMSDVQQIGPLATNVYAPLYPGGPTGSDACIDVPGEGQACDPDYAITGATALAVTAVTPSIASGGIVPVDSTVATIQPGEWVSIFGANLASSTVTWNGNFPTSLGGTSVAIDGKAAYLSFVSPTQINLQAPNDTATGSVPVVVTTAGGIATSRVTLAQFGPSFLLLDSKHVAGIILRSNGSGAYGGGAYDLIGPTENSLGYATVAAKAGDTIELFALGLGPTNPAVPAGQAFSGSAPTTTPVKLLINDVSLTPAFAGLSSAGLYQINLTVPVGLGTGDVSLVATVGGVQTPSGFVISLQ